MKDITYEQIISALGDVGVREGDGLLVHSAIHFLGHPIGGIEIYYRALCNTLGIIDQKSGAKGETPSTGTLAVPTFNFGFACGDRYDPQTTPSEGMGSFSEYVRQRPESRRTSHPMQSLAVVGRYATDFASRDTLSAFDTGSAFERMLDLNFKLLLLGADIQAVSMLHYSEQRASVPYRHWKDFKGQVHTQNGWETCTYRMFVRNLDLDPQIELYPVQENLEKRGQWKSVPLNYGQISFCRLLDFVDAVDDFLKKNPWSLVTNRPSAI